jgi:hypothetical protein
VDDVMNIGGFADYGNTSGAALIRTNTRWNRLFSKSV